MYYFLVWIEFHDLKSPIGNHWDYENQSQEPECWPENPLATQIGDALVIHCFAVFKANAILLSLRVVISFLFWCADALGLSSKFPRRSAWAPTSLLDNQCFAGVLFGLICLYGWLLGPFLAIGIRLVENFWIFLTRFFSLFELNVIIVSLIWFVWL